MSKNKLREHDKLYIVKSVGKKIFNFRHTDFTIYDFTIGQFLIHPLVKKFY